MGAKGKPPPLAWISQGVVIHGGRNIWNACGPGGPAALQPLTADSTALLGNSQTNKLASDRQTDRQTNTSTAPSHNVPDLQLGLKTLTQPLTSGYVSLLLHSPPLLFGLHRQTDRQTEMSHNISLPAGRAAYYASLRQLRSLHSPVHSPHRMLSSLTTEYTKSKMAAAAILNLGNNNISWMDENVATKFGSTMHRGIIQSLFYLQKR